MSSLSVDEALREPTTSIPPTSAEQSKESTPLEKALEERDEEDTDVELEEEFDSAQYTTNGASPEDLGIRTRKDVMASYKETKTPNQDEQLLDVESILTYRLTEEQFQDPMAFVESVASVGNHFGAIKIIPPESWQPELNLDINKFRFRDTKQSLSHSTGDYDEKVQFYKDLVEFHRTKQLPLLRLPSIDKRVVDLYKLRKSVLAKGGFDAVCQKKQWAQIGRDLGYTGRIMTSLSTSLKVAYLKVVYSYDCHERAKDSLQPADDTNDVNKRPMEETMNHEERNKKIKLSSDVSYVSNSKNVYSRSRDVLRSKGFKTNFESFNQDIPGITFPYGRSFPYYDFYYWHKGIDVADHPYASSDTAKRLGSFANFYEVHLKNSQLLDLPEDDNRLLETFWSKLQNQEELSMDTATNLPSSIYGSGFPTFTDFKPSNSDYITHPWNLNNLPMAETGILRYIHEQRDTLTRPKLNVNMLYSVSAFSMEDHFLYLTDYHHLGASKVWYFIAPQDQAKYEDTLSKTLKDYKSKLGNQSNATAEFSEPIANDILEGIQQKDQFDIRSSATNPMFDRFYEHKPNLIRFNSDILLSPKILAENDIKLYYTIQKPGEIIIKYPKTYSATVSLGTSLSESVNFASESWIDLGLEADSWLQKQGLMPSFSFFRLLTDISEESKDANLLKRVLPYYNRLIDYELDLRSEIKSKIPSIKVIQNKFDYISDEKMSSCFPTKIVLKHQDKDSFSFDPKNFIENVIEHNDLDVFAFKTEMHVYFSDDKLKSLQRSLAAFAQTPEDWIKKYDECLAKDKKPSLKNLKSLLSESERIMGDIPEADVLKSYLDEADSWIERAQEFLNSKQKSRIRNRRQLQQNSKTSEDRQLDFEDFEALVSEIPALNFSAPEIDQIVELANELALYGQSVQGFLGEPNHTIDEFNDMIDVGKSFGITLKSVVFLERIVSRLDWIARLEDSLKNSRDLDELVELLKEGYTVCGMDDRGHLENLKEKIRLGQYWSREIKKLLSTSEVSITKVSELLESTSEIPLYADVYNALSEIQAKHLEASANLQILYDEVQKHIPDLFVLREENQKKLVHHPEFDKEKFEGLMNKFLGDNADTRPRYSRAKETLENGKELKPSALSSALDSYIKQVEEWLRKSKKLFGKTNAPFHVLKTHLSTLLDKATFALSETDTYVSDLKEDDHKIFCFCRKLESGTMIECEKCNEWYHCKCLKMGRGKSKAVEKFICPVCDYRIEVPKEYNTPKMEDLQTLIEEGSFFELAPDELGLIRSMWSEANNFRKFLKRELKWDETGTIIQPDEIGKLKFYFRKLEGSSVMLLDEYNQLRQLIWKLDPCCEAPPPIVENSTKTRKKRTKAVGEVNCTVTPTASPAPLSKIPLTNGDSISEVVNEAKTVEVPFGSADKSISEKSISFQNGEDAKKEKSGDEVAQVQGVGSRSNDIAETPSNTEIENSLEDESTSLPKENTIGDEEVSSALKDHTSASKEAVSPVKQAPELISPSKSFKSASGSPKNFKQSSIMSFVSLSGASGSENPNEKENGNVVEAEHEGQ